MIFYLLVGFFLSPISFFAGRYDENNLSVEKAAAASRIDDSSLLIETNRVRESKGLLEVNSALQRAAQNKAEDMVEKEYFSHMTPSGKTPWQWIDEMGYEYSSAGENLAVNFDTSEGVVDGWMNSESHKRNIMNEKFTDVGIGIAKGKYEGQDALYVVELYGQPKQEILRSFFEEFIQ